MLQQMETLPAKLNVDDHTDEDANDHYMWKEGELVHQVQLGQCCYPLPGDAITGSLTPDQGMIVHRSNCQVLRRQQDNTHSSVDLNWHMISPDYYQTPITIVAHDRSGLLRDVAAVVSDAGINMTAVTSATNTAAQKATITATLEISAETSVLDQIERLLRRLRQVKNVVTVERAVSN